MEEREEKYVPDMLTMSMDEQAGGADANKKRSEKRLEKFKKGIEEVKDRRFYDETGLRRKFDFDTTGKIQYMHCLQYCFNHIEKDQT